MHLLPTRYSLRALLPICAFSICTLACRDSCAADSPMPPAASRLTESAANLRSVDRLPLTFEINCGHADARAKFIARGRDVGLFFTDQGAVIALSKSMPHVNHRLPGGQLPQDADL